MSQNPEQYNQYSQQAPSYSQAPGQQPNGYVVSSKDDQNMAMLAHLASAILSLLSFASASILAPLVMWFIYKDKPGYAFTTESARRAFNFNFSLWLASMASWLLMMVTFGLLFFVPLVVSTVVTVLMVIFHSLAAMAANRGEQYTYPMTFIEIIK